MKTITFQHTKTPMLFRLLQKAQFAPGGCLEWRGAMGHSYGVLEIDGRQQQAHRVSYEVFVGPIGKLWVLHRCDNRTCINPNHLFLGTHADNVADMVNKGRQFKGHQTGYCRRGHEFTEENSYREPSTGTARCRTCRKMYSSNWTKKLKKGSLNVEISLCNRTPEPHPRSGRSGQAPDRGRRVE